MMSLIPADTQTLNFLSPLQPKRTRTETVTAQLAALGGLSRGAVLRRAADPDRRLERETLVAVVRGFLRAGREDDAEAVLLLLLKRVSGAIAAKTADWAGLTAEDKIDAKQQMTALLCEKVCDLRPGAEFWECNFTTSFNRASISLWHSLTDHALPIVSNTIEMSGGEMVDRVAQYADPAEAFGEIEMEDLVELMSGGSAKRSRALFLKLNGFPDEDTARRLNVTTRTLRNWTAEAYAVWTRLHTDH